MNTRAGYEDLQGRLRWLLIRNEDQLPKTTVEFITEFIDANECGLALETLSEMLVESEARVDRKTVDAVAVLACDMGLDQLNARRLHALLGPAD
jgi:hypothetical protein